LHSGGTVKVDKLLTAIDVTVDEYLRVVGKWTGDVRIHCLLAIWKTYIMCLNEIESTLLRDDIQAFEVVSPYTCWA
jgi:hypothetical protein